MPAAGACMLVDCPGVLRRHPNCRTLVSTFSVCYGITLSVRQGLSMLLPASMFPAAVVSYHLPQWRRTWPRFLHMSMQVTLTRRLAARRLPGRRLRRCHLPSGHAVTAQPHAVPEMRVCTLRPALDLMMKIKQPMGPTARHPASRGEPMRMPL